MKSIVFKKNEGFNVSILTAFINKNYPLLKNGLWELSFDKPIRTNLENKTFHGWLRIISEETGQDQRTLYQYYCEKFIPLSCSYYKDGRFCSGGTSTLTTKQFAVFLTEIKAEVQTELGIELPTSDQKSFDEFYSEYCK
jgi:hypothetical protein